MDLNAQIHTIANGFAKLPNAIHGNGDFLCMGLEIGFIPGFVQKRRQVSYGGKPLFLPEVMHPRFHL